MIILRPVESPHRLISTEDGISQKSWIPQTWIRWGAGLRGSRRSRGVANSARNPWSPNQWIRLGEKGKRTSDVERLGVGGRGVLARVGNSWLRSNKIRDLQFANLRTPQFGKLRGGKVRNQRERETARSREVELQVMVGKTEVSATGRSCQGEKGQQEWL